MYHFIPNELPSSYMKYTAVKKPNEYGCLIMQIEKNEESVYIKLQHVLSRALTSFLKLQDANKILKKAC